nr:hypothetical protein REQ54_04291 [Rhizobium sp. Q54]
MQPEDKDPRHHTQNMQRRFQEMIKHLRADVERIDEPQLKAMLETSAEVLGGLKKAFCDYEEKKEAAWQGRDDGQPMLSLEEPLKRQGDDLLKQ